MRRLSLITLCLLASAIGCNKIDRQRKAETTAVPSATHPLAGMWKDHCEDDFGLAIAPAGEQLYSISFCGPGGCFEPGTYRPNSRLIDDPSYRILDDSTMEVQTKDGFVRHVRCDK